MSNGTDKKWLGFISCDGCVILLFVVLLFLFCKPSLNMKVLISMIGEQEKYFKVGVEVFQ